MTILKLLLILVAIIICVLAGFPIASYLDLSALLFTIVISGVTFAALHRFKRQERSVWEILERSLIIAIIPNAIVHTIVIIAMNLPNGTSIGYMSPALVHYAGLAILYGAILSLAVQLIVKKD